MSVVITQRLSTNKKKYWYYLEWGKHAGERMSAGVFTFVNPENLIQRNHNKESLAILESKKSKLVLEMQSKGTTYVPAHRMRQDFLAFYKEFVDQNSKRGNRHLICSYFNFQKFIGKKEILCSEINPHICEKFRQYLLENLHGETPANYFSRFKKIIKAAYREGYFYENPTEFLASRTNKNFYVKEILTAEEYKLLLKTSCKNYEIQKAFVFSLYTGIRWVDVKNMTWASIQDRSGTFKFCQQKTNVQLERPLHEIARHLLGERKEGLLFKLPTLNGANKLLKEWCRQAGVEKHITWHCARHSFSVLLQDSGVDLATVAGMLGHTSTKYVMKTYQRYQESNGREAILNLPTLEHEQEAKVIRMKFK